METSCIENNLSNEKCIVVEFVNENSVIGTGFLNWVNENLVTRIDDIIEKEEIIVIKWPNVDPCEASKMQSKLKKAKFENHPVKVLAFGNWTSMKEKENNLIKFGRKETTKSARKDVKRKNYSSSDDEKDESAINSSQKSGLKKNKNVAKDLLKGIMENTKNDDTSEVNYSSDDNMSFLDSDDNSSNDLKQQLNSVKKDLDDLKIKYKNLNENNLKLQDNYDNLKEKYNNLMKNYNDLQLKFSNIEIENQLDKKEICRLKNLVDSAIKDLKRINQISCQSLGILDATSSFSSILKDVSNLTNTSNIEDLGDLNSSTELNVEYTSSTKNKKSRLDDNLADDKMNSENFNSSIKEEKNSGEHKKDKMSKISSDVIKKCRKDSVTNFTLDLMSSLFTQKELATSSANGKRCNAHKDKNYKIKPALDPIRLKQIKALVVRKFGDNPDNKKLLSRAVRSKLSSAALSYEDDLDSE